MEAVITKSASKFCELDPLPTWLLEECIVELAPVITSIIDASIRNSCVPSSWTVDMRLVYTVLLCTYKALHALSSIFVNLLNCMYTITI